MPRRARLRPTRVYEDDARRAQRAEARQIVLPVGIDDERVRQAFGRLMMVEDDDVEPERAGAGDDFVRGHAAIDGDEQVRAGRAQFLDGFGIRAIALENAVGNAYETGNAAGVKEARQQRGRTGAVDIVIAENRHGLAVRDSARETFDGGVHVLQDRRIGHERAQGRIEIGRRLVDAHAPARQHARQNVRHAVALNDGQRALLAGYIEARAPGTPERRTFDVEEEAKIGVRHAEILKVCQGLRSKRRP